MNSEMLHLFQQAFSSLNPKEYLNILLLKIRENDLDDFELYSGKFTESQYTAIVYQNYVLYFAEKELTAENLFFFNQKRKEIYICDLWKLEDQRLENKVTASVKELTTLLLFSNQRSSGFAVNDSLLDLFIEKSNVIHCAKIDGNFYIIIAQDGMIGYHQIYWGNMDTIKKILLKSNDFNSMFF